MAKMINYSYEQLKTFCEDAFKTFGFTEDEAAKITDVLLLSDVYGIKSHGMQRLVRYHKSIENGSTDVHAKPTIVTETPVSAVVDGNMGMGQLVGIYGMNLAIEKAKKSGIGMVTVRNSNHFGIAGYYAKMACDQGLMGVAATNSESITVHTFSSKALLGSNPLAFAMPAEPYPFFFDAATCVVPRGRLEVYNKLGKPLPEGWAVDDTGSPSSDAARVLSCIVGNTGGGILPLGGSEEESGSHKGYGYAMVCEIMCAILSGGKTSNYHSRVKNQGTGTCHCFMAIDPKIFGDPEEIKERLSVLLGELRNSPKANGHDRIYTHGEKEVFAYKDRMENGIALDINTVAEMKDLCDYLGMDSVKYLGDIDFNGTIESSYK